MSVYLCSDLHGQYDLYIKMLDDIGFSQDDHLYILGDIIDRGPKSIEILQDVMNRNNVTCLIVGRRIDSGGYGGLFTA